MKDERPAPPALVHTAAVLAILCIAFPPSHSVAADSGSIVGVVTLDGPVPKRRMVNLMDNSGNPSDCHHMHKQGLEDENLVVDKDGHLANVFVYVKKGLPKRKYDVPKEAALIDQELCMFKPRVQGILVGQELLMRNSDPVIHNVRALALKNRAFNIAQPAESPDRAKLFTKPENKIKIQCDFHPWMAAFVFVMDHPFFAVSDETGSFRLDGLPEGNYTLGAWHEEFGEQEIKVAVTTGSSELSISFDSKGGIKTSGIAITTLKVNTGHHAAAPKKKRKFVKMWQPDDFSSDLASVSGHDIESGRKIFEEANCNKCHDISGKTPRLGPDLLDAAVRHKGPKLLEQLLKPSAEIHKDYQTQVLLTEDGRVLTGLVIKEDDEEIHILPNPLKPEEFEIVEKATIEQRSNSQLSTMPEGLLMTFEKTEILDLLAFLNSYVRK